MRRVVITGMGIWSCLGKNKEEVAVSLREGRSGIGIDPQRTEYGYRSTLTGIVEKPQLKGVLDRKLRMYLAEEGEYAYMATLEAFKQAGVDDAYLLENEVGSDTGCSNILCTTESDTYSSITYVCRTWEITPRAITILRQECIRRDVINTGPLL